MMSDLIVLVDQLYNPLKLFRTGCLRGVKVNQGIDFDLVVKFLPEKNGSWWLLPVGNPCSMRNKASGSKCPKQIVKHASLNRRFGSDKNPVVHSIGLFGQAAGKSQPIPRVCGIG